MPTYDYRCPNDHTFELFQKMSDDPVATCPECGEEARRLLSGGAGFLFKGEGFYITDYRSEEYRKKAAAEKGDGAAGDGPKSDSKGDKGSGSGDAASGAGAAKTGGDGGSKEKGAPGGSG